MKRNKLPECINCSKPKGLLLLFYLMMAFLQAGAQTTTWNSGSFAFTRDNSVLADMTGAIPVTFTGTVVYTSPSIPFSGFDFQFGLKKFTNLYISPYGFIKLGNAIVSNNPEQDTMVIAALYNGTFWNASYKTTGAAPDRKMVIEYDGTMQPSGEPAKYQIWLYERTGRIQFVYQGIRGFYGYNPPYPYRIFCRNYLLTKIEMAALNVKPNNALPTVSYTTVPTSYDSIYPNTRYTFQPDTVKPVSPSALGFSNVQAGCLTVSFNDNSTNESVFLLEKADSVTNFKPEKYFYFASPNGSTVQSHNQSNLQPFWTYHYRVFASNGFINSDTIVANVQTLMPQINGLKQVPRDNTSLTSLLQKASCKHLGPDLVIELQNNYSQAAETFPVAFNKKLQNRLINSITIRPAANATINMDVLSNVSVFYVDSVKHIRIDGRPGGTGTTIGFNINQQKTASTVIQYTNAADSGEVSFCRLTKTHPGGNLNLPAVVTLSAYDSLFLLRKDVNAFTLSNCVLTNNGAMMPNYVFIKATDSTGCRNMKILNNRFNDFVGDGIYLENGGSNSLISGNRFYQTQPITPYAFLPINSASCIKMINTETITIDGNDFGGSSPAWGQGLYQLHITELFVSKYNFIDYRNAYNKTCIIRNNRFGNIKSDDNGYPHFIYAQKGTLLIDNNRFGTTDSTNSITYFGNFWGLNLNQGRYGLTNNFFSGIQGQYNNPATNGFYDNDLITISDSDSSYLKSNDIGGSNNPNANTAKGLVNLLHNHGSFIIIRNNQLRGFYSRNRALQAIRTSGLTSTPERMFIDSNSFHHLKAAGAVYATNVLANSTEVNTISYNDFYAFTTTGEVQGFSTPEGSLNAIQYSIYNFPSTITPLAGEIQIFGNRIHSFSPINVGNNAIYNLTGINTSSLLGNNIIYPKSKVWNNSIRFGINTLGEPIDTNRTGIQAISGARIIENNSIYIGGRGFSSTGIDPYDSGYVTNNIIQIDRVNINPPSPHVFQKSHGAGSISANNLWYSANDPTVPALLTAFKTACNCDVSSFTGNPSFINPVGDSVNYNLHFTTGSMADSTGTPPVLGFTTDRDGLNRNAYSPVDIGCYVATPCPVLPTIDIQSPAADTIQLCAGGSLLFTAAAAGGTFLQLQWQKNLVDIAGANALTYTVTTNGNYRIVGKDACGRVASRTIVVLGTALQASVSIAVSAQNICSGTPVQFTATPVNGGTNPAYQWQVNGVNAGINSPVFSTNTLVNGDLVKVLMTTVSCNVTNTATSNIITLQVIASPVANAGPDQGVCSGAVTIGTPPVGNNTYSWTSNPLGFTSNLANPSVSPMVTTTYYLTVTNGTCSSRDTVIISFGSLSVNAGPDRANCPGISTAIGSSPIAGYTYNWISIPSGFNSNLSNPVVSPTVTTSYIITATNATCTGKDTVVVTVLAPPVANAGPDKSICNGSATGVLIGTQAVAGNTYAWSPAAGLNATNIAQPNARPLVNTFYTLTVTNASGCSSIDQVAVNLTPGFVINITDTLYDICLGDQIRIGVRPQAGYTYVWTSTPSGYYSINPNPLVSPVVSTVYLLTQTHIATSCQATARVHVNVDSCIGGVLGVYPNPANDHIIVQLDINNNEPKYFNLVDARGAQVISQELKYRTRIDVSTLSSGIYFYSIRVGFGKLMKGGKLVIRH